MRILVTVARLGSFAEAARQLRLSASVATRSIAQLEDQLGLMLLTRTMRSLRLTDRGEMFLASCRQILTDTGRGSLACSGEADLRHPVKGGQFVLTTLVS
jgi:DNA-binding transcriptional LysR family regulator